MALDKAMTLRRLRDRLLLQEDLNFLLTNRLPRITATLWMGRLSRVRSRRLTRVLIALWRLFTDLDLSDSRHTEFESLRDCFTRELQPGARPFDPHPDVLCSPCDALVGAMGEVEDATVWQAKGFPYTLQDLTGSEALAQQHAHGRYITLRLTSAMYHRFHAPHDLRLQRVTYLSGDTWNVNPIALARVERLFCKNERAVLETRLTRDGSALTLVPVAAVLVASIRLHALDVLLHLRYRGPKLMPCDAPAAKGDELGWFEHGSTIILFLPRHLEWAEGVVTGARLRAGQALCRWPDGHQTVTSSG